MEFVSALVPFLGVLEEAEFYNIASLVRLVKERIRDNENRTSQVMPRNFCVMKSVVFCSVAEGRVAVNASSSRFFV